MCASGRRRRAYPLTVRALYACARARVFVSCGVWYSLVVACCCCRCLCLSFTTPGFCAFLLVSITVCRFFPRPLFYIYSSVNYIFRTDPSRFHPENTFCLFSLILIRTLMSSRLCTHPLTDGFTHTLLRCTDTHTLRVRLDVIIPCSI